MRDSGEAVTQQRLRINEVFYSIQGESSWAGRPCLFVRLTGCPLRCTYCDTEYAFYEGAWRTFEDILDELQQHPCKLVEVTGGEPLSQPWTIAFLQVLLDAGYTVLLETSGAIDIGAVPSAVHRIVDLKTPDSGEMHRNLWSNIDHLGARDEVKFVIASRRDYEWARSIDAQYDLGPRVAAVLYSPVAESDVHQDLAQWLLQDGVAGRFQLQLHKQIWPHVERGV
jgi:7-carboxy-7-deazaguanine synthase